jgi:sialidase-1
MNHSASRSVAAVFLIAALVLGCARQPHTAHSSKRVPPEGTLTPFLTSPRFEQQSLYEKDRFPNVVVTRLGTVLAFWNGVQVRRSEDAGATWSEPILVGKGFMGGGAIASDSSGAIIAFVEESHPPAALKLYRSEDDGKTWQNQPFTLKSNRDGNVPSMHMNEHGIVLRHGPHRGRLLRTSRWYAGKNDKEHHPRHYTDAIFSDDGGTTWQTSEPFPAMGTGEAAVAELSDGRIYYNSRRHWAPPGVNARRRWVGWSHDGGMTWKDVGICEALPDGDQDRDYGLMGGLVRLPVRGRDVLLFSNIESASGRHGGTLWASFDGGKTWPIKRRVTEGAFAYSSLDAGRPGTPSDGWIFLLYESGSNAGTIARFNLSWVLGGQLTGDGSLPARF